MEGAQRLVSRVVRLDRLPPSNSLEGLQLLRDAWVDYDISMALADRYKAVTKMLFAMQLLVSWCVIVFATVKSHLEQEGSPSASTLTTFDRTVFALSVTVTGLVAIEGLLHAKSRWRQLRSGGSALHSLTWCYRTRVGAFELDESRRDSSRPERKLCSALQDWRDSVIAGANVATSNFRRKHHPSIYKHCELNLNRTTLVSRVVACRASLSILNQFTGGTTDPDKDDFHSPTQPVRYIELRIKPMLSFYEERIPRYTRHGILLKFSVVLLGLAASVIASENYLTWVAIVTAAAAAVTTWTEFSDTARKVERYSRAVCSLQNTLTWWSSLSEVEKASKDNVANLVLSSERIISEEQSAWVSTAGNQERTEEEEQDMEKRTQEMSSKL
eukprot:251121-Prymnesium_polylepis.2